MVKYASQDLFMIIQDPYIWADMIACPEFLRHVTKYALTHQNAIPGDGWAKHPDDWVFEVDEALLG